VGQNNINLLTDCQQSNNLVFAKNGNFFTTSETIAQGTENEHRAVLQMIEKYQDKLERFGGVAFEMIPFETAGGVQNKRIANLNKPQSMFLMTLLRNNDVVVDFKVRLVEEFEKLAEQVKQAPRELSRKEILTIALELEQEIETVKAVNFEQSRVISKMETTVTEQKDVIYAQDDFIDRAFKVKSEMSINKYCKLVNLQPNKFRNLMKISGRFVYDSHSQSYMPSSEMLSRGHMDYKDNNFTDESGRTHEHTQIFITKYGAKHIYTFCKKYKAFFDMLEHETKGYLFMPMQERKAFLNSLISENNDLVA